MTSGLILSRYLNYKDAIKSEAAIRHGVDNEPRPEQVRAMKSLCMAVYDPICDYFGRAIPVTSFFRSEAVNRLIGGSKTSQHCKGEAMDLDCDGIRDPRITNIALFGFIKDRLDFDQLIWEFGTDTNPAWVHVSYANGYNRNQVLRAQKQGKKTIYTQIL